MTFSDKLRELDKAATEGPWGYKTMKRQFRLFVERPLGGYSTIGRMKAQWWIGGITGGAPGDADNSPEANAKLTAFLRNHTKEILALVEAAEYVLHDDGLLPRATSKCRSVVAEALANLNKEK